MKTMSTPSHGACFRLQRHTLDPIRKAATAEKQPNPLENRKHSALGLIVPPSVQYKHFVPVLT